MATTVPARHIKFWREFFALYESLPVLWDARHVHYKYRDFKYDAYNKLVEKLRELEPEADLHYVLRRINIFRTNYRRERARVLSNKNAGKDYKSTLWYYNMLSFLQTQETARKHKRRNLVGAGSTSSSGSMKYEWATQQDAFADNSTQQSFDNFSMHGDEEFKTEQYDTQTNHQRSFNDLDANHVPYAAGVGSTTQVAKDNHATHHMEINENECLLLSPKIEINESDVCQQETSATTLGSQHNVSPKPFQHALSTLPPSTISVSPPPSMVNTSLQALERNLAALSNPDNALSNPINEQHTKLMPIKLDDAPTRPSTPLPLPTLPTSTAATQLSSMNISAVSACSNRSEEETPALSAAAQILARSWALQYDEMSPEQKIYARKAIADILFDGCMGRLGGNGH